jgi:Rha family phage regulatory protein
MELVIVNHGKATTTSLKVAEYFSKQHKNVIQTIENLLQDQDVSSRLNFQPSNYVDSTGRTLPMYELDRDGFTLLAMGFTGKQALQFKLSYIDAFNKAEQIIKGMIPAPQSRPEIEAADIFKTYNEIGKLIGFDENMAAFSANHATTKIMNVNVLELMGVTRLIAPVQMADMTPTQLGQQMNPPRNPEQVNEMLVQLGYQVRTNIKQCRYEATEKGKSFSRLHDTPRLNNAGTVQQLRWYATVLDQQDVRWASGMITH